MSEIIERGAEAMKAKRRQLINQPLERIWPDLMRAALSVMREPSADMLLPANDMAGNELCWDADENTLLRVYQAMIDAALTEKSPTAI